MVAATPTSDRARAGIRRRSRCDRGVLENRLARCGGSCTLAFLLLVTAGSVPAFADSDGYFCVGPDYLAYQFGMAAPPVRPHVLHVIRFTSQRFFDAPATIELPQFQVHGMLCEAGRIRVARPPTR